jgi:ABC-2 type transport system permease protein
MTGNYDWASIGLLWAAVWGLGSVAFLIHRRLYRLAYSRAQEGGPGSYASFTWLENLFDRLQAGLAPEARAFARKDTKMMLRDPGQWSQLLILITLIIAYVYNYAVYPGADRDIAGIKVNHLLGILNLVLASFVVSALVARFAFPAVSIEGRAFWLVRTSPLPARRFLAIKFRMALIPLLPIAISLAGLTAFWLKLPMVLIAVTVIHMAVAATVMTSLGLGLGALYPKFKFENPAQVPMSFGGIVFMLIATAYAVLMSLATAWLAAPMAIDKVSRGPAFTITGWAIWLTFNLALAMIPLRLASRALATKEYV